MYSKKITPGCFCAEYNENLNPAFLKIKHLFLSNESLVILIQKFTNVEFNTHYNCFEVINSNEFEWMLLSECDLQQLKFCSVYQNYMYVNIF